MNLKQGRVYRLISDTDQKIIPVFLPDFNLVRVTGRWSNP